MLLPIQPRACHTPDLPDSALLGWCSLSADGGTLLIQRGLRDLPDREFVYLFDVDSGEARGSITAAPGMRCEPSPAGRYVLGCDAARKHLELWDSATGQTWATLAGGGACFSGDDRLLAYDGSEGRSVHVWDIARRSERLRLHFSSTVPEPLETRPKCLSPDGRWLVVADGLEVQVWDVERGQKLHALAGHELPVTAVALGPNGVLGSRAAGPEPDQPEELFLWELPSGALRSKHRVRDECGRPGELQFQGALFRLGAEWHRLAELAGRDSWTPAAEDHRNLGSSPDGRYVAAYEFGSRRLVLADDSDSALLWTDRTPRSVVHLPPVFSPDGRLVFLTTESVARPSWVPALLRPHPVDGELRVWDPASRKEVGRLRGYVESFSRDGTLLLTADLGRSTFYVWDLPPRKPLARILALSAAPALLLIGLMYLLWRRRAKRHLSSGEAKPTFS